MSINILCPKCGASNQSGSAFCSHCGSPLAAVPPVPPQPSTPTAYPTTPPFSTMPPASSYPTHDYYTDMQQRERMKQIDRTKTGLLLLIIGLIVAALPVVGIIGGILELVGAIMVIMGRDVFGPGHARNTILSLILYIVGFVVVIAGAVAFGFSIVGATLTGTVNQAQVVSGVDILLASIVASSAITGIAVVLFTYALQKRDGKILLWVGYAIGLAVSALILIFVASIVDSTIASAFSSGTYNSAPVLSLQAQASAIGILGIVPAIIYAIAFFMARERIERGEIPVLQQPTAPTTMPSTY